MNKTFLNYIKKYDYSFFGTIFVIFVIGILNLYSATHSDSNLDTQNLYKAQLLWFSVSLLVGVIVSLFVSSKTIFRFSYFLYGIGILLLLLVEIMGHTGMGAQRWLNLGGIRIQPSEFMKLALVMALSRYFSKVAPDRELGLKDLIVPGLITFVPALLVVLQPDLGTGLLFFLIFFVMAFYKRLKWKSIIKLVVMGILAGTAMYNFGLKDYQRKRIHNFINPYADARGSGYNAIQSQIAIGSGRFLGKGFKNSSQASLNYLPENHTDFVFSIFNEEHGFVGSFLLIALYMLLLMRLIWLSGAVLMFFDSVFVIGLMSIFFWHILINMGMVMGLMPIVGIPLPLMSYGGSSLMTFGVAIGLVTSLSNSRNLF